MRKKIIACIVLCLFLALSFQLKERIFAASERIVYDYDGKEMFRVAKSAQFSALIDDGSHGMYSEFSDGRRGWIKLSDSEKKSVKCLKYARLDVNMVADGQFKINGDSEWGLFDVYIDGKRVAQSVCDFWEAFPNGSSYKIENVVPKGGYAFKNLDEGSKAISGTLSNKSETYVNLKFEREIGTITLNQSAVTLCTGAAQQLWIDVSGKRVTTGVQWTTDNAHVVSVSNGKVSALMQGKARVMASYGGQAFVCDVLVINTSTPTEAMKAMITNCDTFAKRICYSSGEIMRSLPKGTAVKVKGQLLNNKGELWYLLDDDTYVNSADVKSYSDIVADTTLQSVPGVKQQTSAENNNNGSTCTSAATVAMLNRYQALMGNEVSYSYATFRKDAVNYDFKLPCYPKFDGKTHTVKGVKASAISGSRTDYVVNCLSEHPEGIVIYFTYAGSGMHAILFSDYEIKADGTYEFYVYDSANSSQLGRRKFTECWLYNKLGLDPNKNEYEAAFNSFKVDSPYCIWYIER